MDLNYVKAQLLDLIQHLNEGVVLRTKYMPRKKVYRITQIGKLVDCNGTPTDGWHIAHKIKHALNYVWLKQPITDEEFFSLPITVYSKYIEISL